MLDNYPKSFKTLIKYGLAGTCAVASDILLLFAFTHFLHINYLVSSVIAFVVAFFVSFFLQKYWTFEDFSDGWIGEQLNLHFIVAIVNLSVNTAGMWMLVEIWRVHYLLAQVFMLIVISVTGLISYCFFVFEHIRRRRGQSGRKILIVSGIFPPDIGGPATYAQTLCRELPGLGYEVSLLSYADDPPERSRQIGKAQAYFVNRKKSLPWRYLLLWWELLHLVPEHDIVYVQGPVSEGLPTWLACRLARVPYYLKVVGDYAWEQGRQRGGVKDGLDDFQDRKYGFRVEMWRRVQRRVARGARAIVVPSEYLKKIVGKWGVSAGKISVIYNSANKPDRFLSVEEAKQSLGITGTVIISVGRLVPWKGMVDLIGLMPSLLEHEPACKLFIIGQGPEYKKLERKIGELGLEDKVFLLGSMPQSRLWFYMMAADVFVLNTAYEGLSHLIIEAMSLGVPVAATRIGGNPELIDDRENGLLYEPGDLDSLERSIWEAVENEELREELLESAYEKANEFSQGAMIKGIIDMFDRYEDNKPKS